MNSTHMRCTCGKLFRSEKALEQHKHASRVHRDVANVLGGSEHNNISSIPASPQHVLGLPASGSVVSTSAPISEGLKSGGAAIGDSAENSRAAIKKRAVKSQPKSPHTSANSTRKTPIDLQQVSGSPATKASSSFILGVEHISISCCGRNFKTENAMQQHKRDSRAHPKVHGGGYKKESYRVYERYYSSSHGCGGIYKGEKGDDFGLCDKDCGWCGHSMPKRAENVLEHSNSKAYAHVAITSLRQGQLS
ncbi:hypothetical protein K504DRAFT_490195 [Pleomassaria siparia CBS 279.74]|uniref:C2H2-type domain-containing protein n=1 Tax=Pleomassaria siparia CBS 279.74 TaxID=1314801 RepID=A0A6G1KAP3_9PLEO|nr:hypothetical protein K504DRAFT_490195 [Pleomassaria siparia CBS 279.74]